MAVWLLSCVCGNGCLLIYTHTLTKSEFFFSSDDGQEVRCTFVYSIVFPQAEYLLPAVCLHNFHHRRCQLASKFLFPLRSAPYASSCAGYQLCPTVRGQ